MGYRLFISNMVETKTITSLEEKSSIAELKTKVAAEFSIQVGQVALSKADGTHLGAPTYQESQTLQAVDVPTESTLLLIIQ